MKKETEKMLEWMREVIERYDCENANAAIDFINKLPDIEAKLCKGGYIQDCNGDIICHGDNVIYKNKECGYLHWDSKNFCFFFKDEYGFFKTFHKNEIRKIK